MSFFVENLFSKCEHTRIKLRIYPYLLNKFLKENSIFCVVNVIDFTTQSCKFFFKPNCWSLYTSNQSTLDTDQYPVSSSETNFWHVRKGQNFQHRTYCTIINILLEHRTFFKLTLVEEVLRNLQVNYLPKQFSDTIRRGILLQRENICQ